MRTILLDDEPLALQALQQLCLQIPEVELLASFSDSGKALDFLSQNEADLVITDIEMPGLTGLEAMSRLYRLHPGMGIIFVTGYEEFALQAFQLAAVAYLLKPCTVEALQNAVRRAALLAPPRTRVKVQTFGHFALSIDGTPVRFANRKAKELLALLVNQRGAVVTMEQAIAVLWEERSYDVAVKRLYRKAVSYLHHLLDGTDFFLSDRGSCHIHPAKADCDYFRLDYDPSVLQGYNGEYLAEYSWAESTNGRIWQLLESWQEGV